MMFFQNRQIQTSGKATLCKDKQPRKEKKMTAKEIESFCTREALDNIKKHTSASDPLQKEYLRGRALAYLNIVAKIQNATNREDTE